MSKSLRIAIGIQVAIMILVMIPPMLARLFGTTVYLEAKPYDPRDLFRGDYVNLTYPVGESVPKDLISGAIGQESVTPVYVTVTTDRPAKYVSASLAPPTLAPGQACITAIRRPYSDTLVFPQIAQIFIPESTGDLIQRNLESLLAEVSTTRGCNATVVQLVAK